MRTLRGVKEGADLFWGTVNIYFDFRRTAETRYNKQQKMKEWIEDAAGLNLSTT